MFISHIENHWQTVSSLEDFMVFLDLKLNPAEEGKDWIFVLELASIHRAAEFRARLLNTFTSCTSQPNRHLASPATWPQSRLGNQCWQMLPESVVSGQNISHAHEEKKRGVGRKGDAPRSEQDRPPEVGLETCQLGIR